MSIGKRLKLIRKDLGLSQEKFAAELSIHLRSYVSYEHEQRTLPQNVLRTLKELGYSLDWLIGGEGSMKTMGVANDVSHPLYVINKHIPLIDLNHIGDLDYLTEKNEFSDKVLWPMLNKDPYAYALKVKILNDSSMIPFFSPEEIIIVSPIETVMNNDKAILKLKDGRILFKVLQFKGDDIELVSANPKYQGTKISSSELLFAHKVIGSLKT
ncbi:MAG: S24 family peptidase [Candidatus Marinimicrobia bacterium]|nr:S24 family peptidase [Candidatus Neomarinimicrobiota bacterium]